MYIYICAFVVGYIIGFPSPPLIPLRTPNEPRSSSLRRCRGAIVFLLCMRFSENSVPLNPVNPVVNHHFPIKITIWNTGIPHFQTNPHVEDITPHSSGHVVFVNFALSTDGFRVNNPLPSGTSCLATKAPIIGYIPIFIISGGSETSMRRISCHVCA